MISPGFCKNTEKAVEKKKKKKAKKNIKAVSTSFKNGYQIQLTRIFGRVNVSKKKK